MAKRNKIALSKRRLRSAISNGTRILTAVDHRGPEMRRLRDLISDHLVDLGGIDQASHSERILVSKASMICLLTEMQEQTFMKNGAKAHPREIDAYLHCVGNLTRILSTLGLQRRSKDVTPSVEEYLRQQQEEEAVTAEAAE